MQRQYKWRNANVDAVARRDKTKRPA
jgi:hypothetical protein